MNESDQVAIIIGEEPTRYVQNTSTKPTTTQAQEHAEGCVQNLIIGGQGGAYLRKMKELIEDAEVIIAALATADGLSKVPVYLRLREPVHWRGHARTWLHRKARFSFKL